MKFPKLTLIWLIASIGIANIAQAGPAAQALGTCLADSTTGKERKEFAQTIFFGMSAYPDMKQYVNIKPEDIDKANQATAKLVTRLLTENCPEQTKKAIQEDGPLAMQQAFELVGRAAMQELISNPDVVRSFSAYTKYLDMAKLRPLLQTQQQ